MINIIHTASNYIAENGCGDTWPKDENGKPLRLAFQETKTPKKIQDAKMTRPEISRAKLDEFIETASKISKNLVNTDGYSMSPSLRDEELVKRINKACKFLARAHDANIINLIAMNCNSYALRGVEATKHRPSLHHGLETYITPKGLGYSNEPCVPNVPTYTSREYFSSAVKHVEKIARMIKNEFDRPHQVSKRVTEPYRQKNSKWQPAKLTA